MALINTPHKFNTNTNSLTEFRVKLVMKYIIHCYLEMKKDGKKYDFTKKGKLQEEDFLRNGLVDDYLSKKQYKDYYKKYISDNPNVEIYFQKEENQPYLIGNGFADDYIDISVKETKLSDVLSGKTGDEIKFAIECKRIKVTNDYNEYIKDIEKFTSRPFSTFRLPFEGQIAFIENDKINHSIASNEINKRLKKSTTISTTKYLKIISIHPKLPGTYNSTHKRNFNKKLSFLNLHLLLDYTKVIV